MKNHITIPSKRERWAGSDQGWKRVTNQRPCPICGKPSWCLFIGPDDATAAICARHESLKKCGEAGWLHVLRRDGPTWSPRIRQIEISARRIGEQTTDFDKLADEFHAAVDPAAIEKLAESLGISYDALFLLRVGWSAEHGAYTFPMWNAEGRVVGIRLRCRNGRKLSVKGGKEGIFYPDGLVDVTLNTLLICEGPTDTAALNDLGFNAIGRPSCSGGVKHLVTLVSKWRPPQVVIVADADLPGQRGAESLASILVAYATTVKVITPPAGTKDAREWKRRGAGQADVQAMINAAPVRRLSIQVQRKHHGR